MSAVPPEPAATIEARIRCAVLRESLDLVERGVATPHAVDTVVRTTVGRRLSVAGPFAIWEQIGWDLVQVIIGELVQEISNATATPASLEATLAGAATPPSTVVPTEDAAAAGSIQRVGIVGAGLMGHGVALEFAAAGREVCLHDISADLLSHAMGRARVGLEALAGTGRLSIDDIDPALGRIRTTTELRECADSADLVVEAASEHRQLKQRIFGELDAHVPAGAILASNTSTFLPSAYAASTSRPDRVIGVHYFNPPHLLPGVELIRGPETSNETVATVMALYQTLGKQLAPLTGEIQGFIGNRLQAAVLREAIALVEEGLGSAAEIDAVVTAEIGRHFPEAGPLEQASAAGVEATRALLDEHLPHLSNTRDVPGLLRQKVEAGDLGIKVGQGFYTWTPESAEAWRRRMADALLDLAARLDAPPA